MWIQDRSTGQENPKIPRIQPLRKVTMGCTLSAMCFQFLLFKVIAVVAFLQLHQVLHSDMFHFCCKESKYHLARRLRSWRNNK